MINFGIPLSEIVYDHRARDGTWCTLPYPDHPKGCPNFPKCPNNYRDFIEIDYGQKRNWFAVIEEFDLKAWAERRKLKHLGYSERQARNLIYWQNGVRSRLRKKAYPDYPNRPADRIVLEIPEACGVNVFETMAKVGIVIDRHPDIVRKVMLVGRPEE